MPTGGNIDVGVGNARILDYGGGDDRLLLDFAAAGATHIGTIEHDLESLEKYDAVVCAGVIEHLVDPQEALRLAQKSKPRFRSNAP